MGMHTVQVSHLCLIYVSQQSTCLGSHPLPCSPTDGKIFSRYLEEKVSVIHTANFWKLAVTHIFQNISEFIFPEQIFYKVILQMVDKIKIIKWIKKIEKAVQWSVKNRK